VKIKMKMKLKLKLILHKKLNLMIKKKTRNKKWILTAKKIVSQKARAKKKNNLEK